MLGMTPASLLQARQVSRLEVHAESRRRRKSRRSGSFDCLCLLGGGLLPTLPAAQGSPRGTKSLVGDASVSPHPLRCEPLYPTPHPALRGMLFQAPM